MRKPLVACAFNIFLGFHALTSTTLGFQLAPIGVQFEPELTVTSDVLNPLAVCLPIQNEFFRKSSPPILMRLSVCFWTENRRKFSHVYTCSYTALASRIMIQVSKHMAVNGYQREKEWAFGVSRKG